MHDPQVLRAILADDHARRELLWLRAKEKDDPDLASDLERLDPGVVARLKAAGADVDELAGEDPRERRERFGRLLDQCQERHERAHRQAARCRP